MPKAIITNPLKLFIFVGLLCITNLTSFAKNEGYNFILVHGAWHGAWAWFELEYLLLKEGNTVTCIDLPGHGSDTISPGKVTLADYQNAIVHILDKSDKPSILVGHSMGGIAISMAAELRPAKISKLVYLAAFLLQDGQSMIQIAMTDTASMVLSTIKIDTVHMVIDIDRTYIQDMFYNSASKKYTILSEKLLRPEPLLPLITPLTLSDNFYSVRRFYITTTNDRAITPSMQQQMYTALPCEKIYTLHTGHSPFISAPESLKNILQRIVKDCQVKKSSTSNMENETIDEGHTITIYPNPTSRSINIGNVDVASDISIYNIAGKLILQTYCTDGGNVGIDLNGNPHGQYIVRIKSKEYTVSKMIIYTE
jgi:pimeloyl-ACP methyl ester carboxylesterase